ncbi:MAG: L,D-transpeptidase family protein [Hyphomicrobiales bacterium]
MRRRLLVSVLVAPAVFATSAGYAQTLGDDAKVELASVDAATTSQVLESDALASETIAAELNAKSIELAEATEKFSKATNDKLDRADRAGIAAFYEDNGYQKVWIKDGKLNKEALALVDEMSRADHIGLNPADYVAPSLSVTADVAEIELFAAELEMSLAAVRFARHIASGRLEPLKVSASLDIHPQRPNAKSVLADLSIADNPVVELNDYHPKHAAYKALLEELETIRTQKVEKQIVVPKGKMLKPGMSDPRVPLLRARLKIDIPELEVAQDATEEEIKAAAATGVDETIYDEALVEAVKEFQKSEGLSQDGIVGPSTLRTLNGANGVDRKAQIIVNLERWRWMPKDLGEFHILANIPEYRVYVKKGDEVRHTTRVVVGKTKHKTVAFSDEMEHFVVNPSWGVPQSIIKNEMLPSARSNPSYFSRKGYQVFARIRGKTRRIDPNRVNWRRVNASQISVRQPPGARNALGQIKFMFPNKHAIYMHDTPSKSLFKRDSRAFSHGCVRIHNPMEFADAILENEPDWNSSRIKKMIGRKEATVNFNKHIPVHIAYFTTIVKEDGSLKYLADVYGHDRKMVAALSL